MISGFVGFWFQDQSVKCTEDVKWDLRKLKTRAAERIRPDTPTFCLYVNIVISADKLQQHNVQH